MVGHCHQNGFPGTNDFKESQEGHGRRIRASHSARRAGLPLGGHLVRNDREMQMLDTAEHS